MSWPDVKLIPQTKSAGATAGIISQKIKIFFLFLHLYFLVSDGFPISAPTSDPTQLKKESI